jgi:hypothetical protein
VSIAGGYACGDGRDAREVGRNASECAVLLERLACVAAGGRLDVRQGKEDR